MSLPLGHRSWSWPLLALVVAMALLEAGLAAATGTAQPRQAPLWTERPVVTAGATPSQRPDWVWVAKEVKPGVVNISTKRVEEGMPPGAPFGGDRFSEPFFGNGRPRTVRSLGSGFVISPNGDIVTNNHVVDGAIDIRARLSDGRELPAKVLGRDPKTDLVLLKVDATGLPVVPLGDSSALQVGEPVMAVGNPFGLEQTVTTGIVSATGRVISEGPYDDFIQTDASINPGNSGGPLVNVRGQAVGINTAMFSRSGGSIGIGFAIPIDLAKPVITQLAETGHVVRGWLGVTIQPLTAELAKAFRLPDRTGAVVSSVVDGSPAAKAGVKPGDVIVEYDGRPVARSGDLPRAVADTPVGREVALAVIRDGQRLTLTAGIARLEEPERPVVRTAKAKASLGLAVESLTPARARELGLADRHGVLVQGVEDGSPAANAGLQPGDVIVEVDRHPVKSADELTQALEKHSKGAPVLFLVHRDGRNLYAAVSA